ncbi:MAG: ABC transporter substrate-binding protein [Bacteroidales bacterium]|jgi:iron complex transport system substrate-binding protein|nr:ABC transporter substrate-binding protein [Bacteroidales bacterium]
MKKTGFGFLAVVLALGLTFGGCSQKRSGDSGVRNIIDMSGQTIAVPKVVNKVHTDWISGSMLVMTLGATDKLTCVSPFLDGDSFAWARLIIPEIEDAQKSMLANVQGDAINVEGVLALMPDLVITDRLSRVEIYENAGLPVLLVNLDNYDNFKKAMLIIGEALGEFEFAKANAYNDYINRNIEMVTERLKDLEETDKQSIYYMYSTNSGPNWATVGRGEIQERWIKMAGGIFATEDLDGRVEEGISTEYILDKDPDIIIIGNTDQAAVYNQLTTMVEFSGLKAVKNNSIVRNPFGILSWCRTGPEYAMQMVWAAKLLHPALFTDIDIEEMAKDFYLEFYSMKMSDENIVKILQGESPPTRIGR